MIKFFKIIIFVFLLIAIGAVFYFYQTINAVGRSGSSDILFTVKPGEGVNQISVHLVEKGLIKNRLIFETYVWLKKSENKLLAGDHFLNTSMNIKNIFEILKSGDSVNNERTITIIEGWRSEETAKYLADRGFGAEKDFIVASSFDNWQSKYDFLDNIGTKTVEGFLFPDTYRIFTGATSSEIIKKMLDNFGRKMSADFRGEIRRQDKTIFETIILASIVEREALTTADKKMIAGIFLNRLEAGIGLQSDATINYITHKGMSRPLLSDLTIDSPYNTYKYRGLPPGPISNPGIEAIKAVIYPTVSDYLYFLTDENGKAYYAKTYEGHLENIRKYLN